MQLKLKPHRTLCSVVFFMVLLWTPAVRGQIGVTAGLTAVQMAQRLAGQGVTVFNPVLHCQAAASGSFTSISSNLGLDSGIVLTTGRAASSPGLYGLNGPEPVLASFDNGTGGDSSLQSLAGQTTLDACTLEFDVIPAGDTVSIDYVFASEEYNSAVCGPYNDAFAFFISGPGIAGADNMALVPGTHIPVTINSINNGVPGSTGSLINCTSMGPGSPFTGYYRDNTGGTTLTYKGMTTVLRAMHTVTACATYHFKIAIADAGNARYDSGVFLEAGSLKTGSYKVLALRAPIADSAAVCIKGCLPGRFRVQTDKARSVPQTVRYTTGGTAISGTDYQPLTDSAVIPAYALYTDVYVYGRPTAPAGPRTLQLTIYPPMACAGGYAADSAQMVIYDTIHIKTHPADTLLCRGTSALLQVTGDSIYSYSWVPDEGLSSAHVMQPVAAPFVTTTYTVTAFIPGTTCTMHSDTIRYNVRATPLIDMTGDTVVCYHSTVMLPGSTVGPDSAYSYSWSGPGDFNSGIKSPLVTGVTAGAGGAYILTVRNDTSGCTASSQLRLVVDVPQPPIVVSPVYFCEYGPAGSVMVQAHSPQWYDSAGMPLPGPPVISPAGVVSYHYFVSDRPGGCESPTEPVLVQVVKCCDGDIVIPSAFTPNDDGLNDLFRPLPGFSYTLRSIEIFNRWGQVVYSSSAAAWDGRYNHMPAPADTYFYHMVFGCLTGGTTERAGAVTLIR